MHQCKKEIFKYRNRETARIQTFPNDYIIIGSQNMWYAQIGNAVPVKFAKAIGDGIIKFMQ